MYFFQNNLLYQGGSNNSPTKLVGVNIGTVITTGTISPNIADSSQRKRDERFNADPYIIRCKIVGANKDNSLFDEELPNCFPLTPKHTAIIPKEGEMVLIFEFGNEGEKYPERFYVGPIISSLANLDYQQLYAGALGGLAISPTSTVEDISKDPDIKGVFSEYDSDYDYSIDGRDNADIVFKRSEIILRAGKFVKQNDKISLNRSNPAFIQIKHGFSVSKKGSKTATPVGCSAFGGCGDGSTSSGGGNVSVNNIVADKINLLTYGDDARPNFNLTYRNNKNNKTPYIDDAELNKILEKAHPLVFGDKLIEYLIFLENAFLNHTHNNFAITPPIQAEGNVVKLFATEGPKLREEMLSKNIKIN